MADLTTLSDLKLYLGVTSSDTDDFYSMLITQASNIIENELGSGVLAADYSETYNGDGTTTMMLDNYPVLEVYRATDSVEVTGDSSLKALRLTPHLVQYKPATTSSTI